MCVLITGLAALLLLLPVWHIDQNFHHGYEENLLIKIMSNLVLFCKKFQLQTNNISLRKKVTKMLISSSVNSGISNKICLKYLLLNIVGLCHSESALGRMAPWANVLANLYIGTPSLLPCSKAVCLWCVRGWGRYVEGVWEVAECGCVGGREACGRVCIGAHMPQQLWIARNLVGSECSFNQNAGPVPGGRGSALDSRKSR